MSPKAIRWVWSQPIHDSSARLVLIHLACHSSEGPGPVIASPSVAKIALDTGLNRKTVYRALFWLRRARFLIARERAGRAIIYVLPVNPKDPDTVPFSQADDLTLKRVIR